MKAFVSLGFAAMLAIAACGPSGEGASSAPETKPAETAAPTLSPEAEAKIAAMTSDELMSAVAGADSELATNLARLSNVASTASFCGWAEFDTAGKLETMLGAVADPELRATARRFYDDIHAKDLASFGGQTAEEVCTPDNKAAVENILADL